MKTLQRLLRKTGQESKLPSFKQQLIYYNASNEHKKKEVDSDKILAQMEQTRGFKSNNKEKNLEIHKKIRRKLMKPITYSSEPLVRN